MWRVCMIVFALCMQYTQTYRLKPLHNEDNDIGTESNEITVDIESIQLKKDRIASLCDMYDQTRVLYCSMPLLGYLPADKMVPSPPHPPLHHIDDLCQHYQDYKQCSADVETQCQQVAAGHLMHVHDVICDPQYRDNITQHRQCLLGMTADVSLNECHQRAISDQKNKNETTESLTCISMQSYIDCLLKHDYWDICPDGVQTEVDLLMDMAPDCDLAFVAPQPVADYTKPQCDHKSGTCTCAQGYHYDAETKYCADVDECAEQPARCSQRCKNSKGSFECLCAEPHYVLANDSVTCVRNDTQPLWIFFAHGQSIWNISEDGKDFQLQRAGLQKTAMIDLDMKGMIKQIPLEEDKARLFYADIGANKIETMMLDGVFPKTIQFYEVEGTEGIGVDWIARNLYSLRKTDVWVQKLDGRFRMKLYSDVLKLPRALVTHPLTGNMYITDWGSEAFIGRAAMDGSKFERIITEGVVWPNALAIDYYADRLYWADAFLDTIEDQKVTGVGCVGTHKLSVVWCRVMPPNSDPAADLNGMNRRTIISEASSVPHVFGMAIADDYVYWTDWTYRGILRADKRTGANVTVLAQTALLPYSIKVYHPAMQPEEKKAKIPGDDPCEDMGCTHLCLLAPNTDVNDTSATQATCGCAQGFVLMEDGRTCKSQCSDNQILCGGSDPRCISKVYWCDGQSQCWDHEDERECPRRVCLPGQFQCHDQKQCLSAGSVCDGTAHCDDKSDETYC